MAHSFRLSVLLGSNLDRADICHRGCVYTVFQTDQRPVEGDIAKLNNIIMHFGGTIQSTAGGGGTGVFWK